MAPPPTQAEVAQHLDLERVRSVRELRDQGVIPDPQDATLDEIRVAYLRHLRRVAAGRAWDGSAELAAARYRKEVAQAEKAEIELAELRGGLIQRDVVRIEWTSRLAALKDRLRGLPKLAHQRVPGLTKAHARALLRLVDDLLRDAVTDGSSSAERRPAGRRRAAVGGKRSSRT